MWYSHSRWDRRGNTSSTAEDIASFKKEAMADENRELDCESEWAKNKRLGAAKIACQSCGRKDPNGAPDPDTYDWYCMKCWQKWEKQGAQGEVTCKKSSEPKKKEVVLDHFGLQPGVASVFTYKAPSTQRSTSSSLPKEAGISLHPGQRNRKKFSNSLPPTKCNTTLVAVHGLPENTSKALFVQTLNKANIFPISLKKCRAEGFVVAELQNAEMAVSACFQNLFINGTRLSIHLYENNTATAI